MSELPYKLFVRPAKHYLIALAMCALFTGGYLLAKGTDPLINVVNALSVSGAIVFFCALLVLVSNLGAFDTVGYGFEYFMKHRYKDLYAYVAAKSEKRAGRGWMILPYAMIGLLFIAAGMLLNHVLIPQG